jgi:uncharacterized RDD family membrane protein YckC
MDKYSTFWPRFWAGLIDGLVLCPISIIDNYMYPPRVDKPLLVIWTIFSFLTYSTYSVLLHARYGQTVGKKAMNIKVMNFGEDRLPSYGQAILRDIGEVGPGFIGSAYLIFLILADRSSREAISSNWVLIALGFANLGWFVLELVTMLTNKKRRALHDLIAGTVVVRLELNSSTNSSL